MDTTTMTATVKKLHEQRLVIADDDYLILATLGAGLRDAGFQVFEAVSGEEAISLCQSETPDLVILDVTMPGMSGLDAAQVIRGFNIPILFLSAFDEKKIVDDAIQQGALAYLVKPVDINQIIPAIDTALSRANEIQSLHVKEKNLTAALHKGRETSIAIGILVAHSQLSAQQAELQLRHYSRNKRLKMNAVAEKIIYQSEQFNNLIKEIILG